MLRGSIVSKIEKVCIDKKIPFHCILELTYRCNLSCRHCYAPKDTDGELSLKEISSILDQLAGVGTFHLVLTGGEILMREDFFDIALSARSKGFFVTLMTNATLIDPEEADKIAIIRPIDIEISLYGAREETHDYVTTVEGSFIQTVNAIKLLVKRGLRVTTKTVILKCNANEHREIEAFSKSLGANPKINFGVIPCKDGSLNPLRHDLSFEDVIKYSLEERLVREFPRSYNEPQKLLVCKAGRAVCSISPKGDVTPCLLMPLRLGSLRERRFEEIWYGTSNELLERLRDIRIINNSTCSKCEHLAFCFRCPGIAYVETGDPVGRSPTACKYAEWRSKLSDHRGANNINLERA